MLHRFGPPTRPIMQPPLTPKNWAVCQVRCLSRSTKTSLNPVHTIPLSSVYVAFSSTRSSASSFYLMLNCVRVDVGFFFVAPPLSPPKRVLALLLVTTKESDRLHMQSWLACAIMTYSVCLSCPNTRGNCIFLYIEEPTWSQVSYRYCRS